MSAERESECVRAHLFVKREREREGGMKSVWLNHSR